MLELVQHSQFLAGKKTRAYWISVVTEAKIYARGLHLIVLDRTYQRPHYVAAPDHVLNPLAGEDAGEINGPLRRAGGWTGLRNDIIHRLPLACAILRAYESVRLYATQRCSRKNRTR